jgi:hypothetical protein
MDSAPFVAWIAVHTVLLAVVVIRRVFGQMVGA